MGEEGSFRIDDHCRQAETGLALFTRPGRQDEIDFKDFVGGR